MTMLVSSSDDSGCDSFLLFLAVDVTTTISCRDLIVSSLAEVCVATKFLCRNTVFVVSQFGSRRDNFLWSPSFCVAITLSCCDLTVFPFTRFCVAASFLCRDTISIVSHFDPWSQLPFHVTTLCLVFCPHANCDSNY